MRAPVELIYVNVARAGLAPFGADAINQLFSLCPHTHLPTQYGRDSSHPPRKALFNNILPQIWAQDGYPFGAAAINRGRAIR